MAHNDDVRRVVATCTACGSVYAARQWPDGETRVIGQEGCSCGSTEFEVIDDSDTDLGHGPVDDLDGADPDSDQSAG